MIDALNNAASALNASAAVSSVTANNIANVNTSGFKSRIASLAEMSRGGVKLSPLGVKDQAGSPIYTGNPGEAAVFAKSDEPENLFPYYGAAYRNFRIDGFGNLLDPSGELLFTGSGGNVRLDNEGNLYKNDELIGRLTPAGGEEYIPTGETILAGYRVSSNVDILNEFVNNMINLRYFQLNALSLRTADEMSGSVVNMKA